MHQTKQQSSVKKVNCTHCQQICEVSPRAKSIFCAHCRKRLILEDYRIKTYRAVGELSTAGDIVIERKGHVVAPIKVGNLTVKGTVRGSVVARGAVKIGKSAQLQGNIEARTLVVENGAVINGHLNIGPAAS